MLNIVVPMAGRGSRFSKVGYKNPKPLISVHGKPMIQVVINNVQPKCDHRFIFICQQEHIDEYNLEERLRGWAPGSVIIGIDGITEGAACTVLKASEYIDNDNPMMIVNSDQYVDIDINDYLELLKDEIDGFIMTMKADSSKWSYAAMDSSGYVERVVEKEVISEDATVGIYNYSRGSDFVLCAKEMIEKNMRVNNEFYVAPVYNLMISKKMKVKVYSIGTVEEGMYGLGTPEDLNYFLNLDISKKAVEVVDKRN